VKRRTYTLAELAPDVDAAEVLAWHVTPGARMVLGDDMLDLVTDKATITIPAPCAGTLIEQLAAAGAKITGADRLLILQPDQ